jgi:3-hydroxyisobutyrate dehydrogenase
MQCNMQPSRTLLCCAVLCRINSEGLGDKDFSSIYRYIYGAGCSNSEWKEGQQLFSSQVP